MEYQESNYFVTKKRGIQSFLKCQMLGHNLVHTSDIQAHCWYVPWNYFMENQKVILQKFWKNKRTVSHRISATSFAVLPTIDITGVTKPTKNEERHSPGGYQLTIKEQSQRTNQTNSNFKSFWKTHDYHPTLMDDNGTCP